MPLPRVRVVNKIYEVVPSSSKPPVSRAEARLSDVVYPYTQNTILVWISATNIDDLMLFRLFEYLMKQDQNEKKNWLKWKQLQINRFKSFLIFFSLKFWSTVSILNQKECWQFIHLDSCFIWVNLNPSTTWTGTTEIKLIFFLKYSCTDQMFLRQS